jgi:glyoxylase-like metal-dependent hydrolase (beta-lactamase superfamily II)
MLARIEELGPEAYHDPAHHTHGDHIFDLDRLKEKTGAPAFVGEREPLDGAQSFAAGRTFQIGALQVESRLTWGHSPGGITYVVRGLAKPVAIVGDAILPAPWAAAESRMPTRSARIARRSSPFPRDNRLPGHGPMTTVGEEKRHNPFLAT